MKNTWISKAKIDLNNIISKLSLESWKKFNIKKDGTRYKKHRQYPLCDITLEAVELLNKIAKIECEGINNIEVEKEVKAFLLPYRLEIK